MPFRLIRLPPMRSQAVLRGRLSIGIYDGPKMDDLVRLHGLERAEELLRPLDLVKHHNLWVLSGRNLLRNFLASDVVTGIERYAIGTNNTTPVSGNTTLGTEVFRNQLTQTVKADGILTVKLYVSSTEANSNTLVEGGPFANGATATVDTGTLIAHATHTAIAKTSSIALVYSHDLVFSAG